MIAPVLLDLTPVPSPKGEGRNFKLSSFIRIQYSRKILIYT
jgi:hypothetical protein